LRTRNLNTCLGLVCSVTTLVGIAKGQVDLKQQFDNYKAAFVSRSSASVYDVTPDHEQPSFIAVSKPLIADVATKSFNGSHLMLLYTRPKQNTHADTIELKTPPDQTNCSPDRWPCDSDCGWLDVGCHTRKVACEAWKASNKAVCEAQKTAREVYSDKIIADLNPGALTTAGSISAGPIQATLDATLTQVSITVPYSGRVWVAGQLYFTPKPLTFLTGCFPHTLTIPDTEIKSSSANLVIPGTVSYEQAQAAVLVKASFTTPTLTLQFSENPIIMMLKNNPHTLLFCPVLESIGVVIGTISGELKKTSYDIGAPSIPELSTKIAPLTIRVANSAISLNPSVTAKSILFTATLQ